MAEATTTVGIPKLAGELERILRRLAELYEQLTAAILLRREAMRRADAAGMEAGIAAERQIVREIEATDQRRVTVAREMAAALGWEGEEAEDLTVTRLASAVGEPVKGRLLEVAGRLKRLGEEAREQSSVVRQAAESLLGHVRGLVEKIQTAVGRASVYGRDGRIGRVAMTQARLDVRR